MAQLAPPPPLIPLPARPLPLRPRSALFLLLPQIGRSLFAAPKIRFSICALALPQRLSRANPLLHQLLLPLRPSSRPHRASRNWTGFPPLPLQPRLPCRPNSNRVQVAAAPLLPLQFLLLPLQAIRACFRKPTAAIPRQSLRVPGVQAGLRVAARSRSMGILEQRQARPRSEPLGELGPLSAPAFRPRVSALLSPAAEVPLRQSKHPRAPARISPSKSEDQVEQRASSTRRPRQLFVLLVRRADRKLRPARSRECAQACCPISRIGKLRIRYAQA